MADPNNNAHIDTLELDPADGQQYVVELRDKLIELLQPTQTIEEVEDRLRKLYPQSELVDVAVRQAHKSRLETQRNHKVRNHSSSSGTFFADALHNITSFAVAKVSNLVREGVVGSKSENEVTKFKTAFIEFIIDDVLNLAGDFVRRQKGNFIITRSDIRTAMHADKQLLDIFLSDDKAGLHHPHRRNNKQQPLSTMTYKQKVRYMLDSENTFIRGLKLITKVIKAQLEEWPHIKNDVQVIFCNIEDLLQLSILLLTALEESLENDDFVGSEILDLALAEEFSAYFDFAYQRLSHSWKIAFQNIVTDDTISSSDEKFHIALRYLLPNYLSNTVVQFFDYFDDFSDLLELSRDDDDRLALKETLSILTKTKKAIEELLELNPNDNCCIDAKQAESIHQILEKILDAELQHERNLPLPYMPPPDIYRFSEPDSKENIQFEDSKDPKDPDQIPVIRSATLIKLVERLTYHKYQPNIVDSFLTTYRSFISDPEELLDLLIERFKIPDPPLPPDDCSDNERTVYKHCLKRFRQEYSKPVKMRVINVLKSWIKNHYYDFEQHPKLLNKLNTFLDEVYDSEKILRTLIDSIKKSIKQKKKGQSDEFEFMLSGEPPQILWWAAQANETERFDILTLHPVEFARQLTLIEFDLFRAIRPSEFINANDLEVETGKNDKYRSLSPNLKRMTRHFTLFSYWVRKCIVEVEDFDKRIAIYNRLIEIMGVLRDNNNFTGLLSIGSAIESAPIVRLSHTRKNLSHIAMKIIDDYRELNEDHQKKLERELRQCNPPCIPYLGSYQTKLIHAKEGNKTFTALPMMINFTKQRIRASLVAEIGNYQNSPYCLTVQPQVRQYIESIEFKIVKFVSTLNSNGGDEGLENNVSAMTKRLDDYLFEQSERIEPKNGAKPQKSKSKLPDHWKSPGIKINFCATPK